MIRMRGLLKCACRASLLLSCITIYLLAPLFTHSSHITYSLHLISLHLTSSLPPSYLPMPHLTPSLPLPAPGSHSQGPEQCQSRNSEGNRQASGPDEWGPEQHATHQDVLMGRLILRENHRCVWFTLKKNCNSDEITFEPFFLVFSLPMYISSPSLPLCCGWCGMQRSGKRSWRSIALGHCCSLSAPLLPPASASWLPSSPLWATLSQVSH